MHAFTMWIMMMTYIDNNQQENYKPAIAAPLYGDQASCQKDIASYTQTADTIMAALHLPGSLVIKGMTCIPIQFGKAESTSYYRRVRRNVEPGHDSRPNAIAWIACERPGRRRSLDRPTRASRCASPTGRRATPTSRRSRRSTVCGTSETMRLVLWELTDDDQDKEESSQASQASAALRDLHG